MASLTRRALWGLAQTAVIVAVALFVGAGSVRYWQGWLFWAVFCGSSLLITLYFLRHDPALVESRLKGGPGAERERSQKWIQGAALLLFVLLMLVPPLEYRVRGGAIVSPPLVVLGSVLVAAGFLIIFFVFRENGHASTIIEVKAGQRVITTGPYARMRHPMYSGGVVMILGTPLALGSLWGFVPALLLCAVIVARLLDEERFLAANLPGYADYLRTVRHRLIPGVW